MLDPEIAAAGLAISRYAGETLRKDLQDAGYSDDEIKEIVREVFAWRHEPVLLDAYLKEVAQDIWGAMTDPNSSDAGLVEDATEAVTILRALLQEAGL